MEDLLGIEVDYLADGSIKLHQKRYIEKVVARFLPKGPLPHVQANSLPYSNNFKQNLINALAQTQTEHPELVKPLQERIGCLMYAATSTRPDIAFFVHQMCQCLQKPTPELLEECDHALSYLSRLSSAGLTYTAERARLVGFADASWEVRNSTSGWCVLWQSAALSWGSRKQKSIALSSCEAEIIALSEAAKDVVYLRRLVEGLGDAEPNSTQLSTDSQSARDISYNPEHHDRMKHVERRHYFVRDMVESLKIEVPLVRTVDNWSDFFTKTFDAKKFHAMRRDIMNEH
jgi:ribonuclease HI